MPSIRFATLNTWKGDGPYADRLAAMADGLRTLVIDVLLLQEVLVSTDARRDTGRALAAALDMDMVFHPARRKLRPIEGDTVDSFSGLAVLSRYPILASDALPLLSDPRDGDRCALGVMLQIAGNPVWVANTHLSHLDDRDDLRRAQLREIVAWLATVARGQLTILGGDLNTSPGDAALAWIEGQDRRPAVNAWQEANGCHYPTTLNIGNPTRCIDHLFRFADARNTFRWTRVETGLQSPAGSGVPASDHLAVVGELTNRNGRDPRDE